MYLDQGFPKWAIWPPSGPFHKFKSVIRPQFEIYARYSGVDDDEEQN